MILQIYNRQKNKVFGLTQVADLCIESTLSSGDKELTFSYPWDIFDIEEEFYIRVEGDEFVVKQVNKRSDERFAEVMANLNVEELEGTVYETFESVEKTPLEFMNAALAETGWSVKVCEVTKRRTIRGENVSVWKLMRDAIPTYGMEVKYDSINKTISCYKQIGEYKGMYAMDGLNIKTIDINGDSTGYYTRILPIGKDGLKLPEIYLENYQFSNKKRTFIWQDDRYTDVDSLREDALKKLETMSKPFRAYTVELANLARMSDVYDGILEYDLGDYIDLNSKTMGIHEKMRVMKMKRYPLEPVRDRCDLENARRTFTEVQGGFINDVKDYAKHKTAMLEGMSKQFAALAAASVGAFETEKKQDDGSVVTYYHDRKELKDSQYIRQESANGILFSADGGKTWKGIDKDGNALLNNICARIINADYIRAGRLEAQIGGAYFDLDKGELSATKMTSDKYPNYVATIGPSELGEGALNVSNNKDCILSVYNAGSSEDSGTIITAPWRTNSAGTNRKGVGIGKNSISVFADYKGEVRGLEVFSNSGKGEYYGDLFLWDSLKINGNLYVGGTKDRIASTSIGTVGISAYETAEPYFGDIGEGETDDNGQATVKIESLFKETVSTDRDYQVFLQPYTAGEFWVKERTPDHFVVEGSANGKFAWEVKARQKGHESERLEIIK